MNKKFLTIVLIVVIVLLVFVFNQRSDSGDSDASVSTDVQDVVDDADNGLNQQVCNDSGGYWNPCGSACRTEPDAVCIELCVEYCECESDDQCPDGFACGDFIDEVGVCL